MRKARSGSRSGLLRAVQNEKPRKPHKPLLPDGRNGDACSVFRTYLSYSTQAALLDYGQLGFLSLLQHIFLNNTLRSSNYCQSTHYRFFTRYISPQIFFDPPFPTLGIRHRHQRPRQLRLPQHRSSHHFVQLDV